MKVYHASSIVVANPDTIHSREYLDFGRGFYITTLREQAEKYALRFLRRGESAVLNIYELSDDLNKWKLLDSIRIITNGWIMLQNAVQVSLSSFMT